MNFSSLHRTQYLQQLKETQFDLLVIGGGITGAGIALGATSRGLKVALIDMQDFAAGTSSRSTKLIHGGLRYLKQFEIKLVAEVGKERKIIHRIAPHLTIPEPMLLPIVKHGSFNKYSAILGMWVYEWLAGVHKHEKHHYYNKTTTMQIEPLLPSQNLKGSIWFYEYRTDDARLTIEVIKESVDRGVTAVNYVKANSFNYKDNKISGVNVSNQLNGDAFTINASQVVNASGPWVDSLDSIDKKTEEHKLQITKGVHLVVDWKKLPVNQSLYLDTFDRRMLFVIPREGKTYIGTTDTFYKEDLVNPSITTDDRDYILKCVNDSFPNQTLTLTDIESGWAGLRPLISKPGKGPSEISRKDELFESETGLLTIAGGKLTGYRKMAERIVNKVAENIYKKQGIHISKCITDTIALSGGKLINDLSFAQFKDVYSKQGISLGLTSDEAISLIQHYGSNVIEIYKIIEQLKNEINELPISLRAQLIYTIQHEMCMTISDFLIRRTGALYFNVAVAHQWAPSILKYMQSLLNWSDEETKHNDLDFQMALNKIKLLNK